MRDARRWLGAKLVLWALLALAAVLPAVSEAVTQDLTNQFAITRSGLVLNRTTNTFDSIITLRNSSDAPVLAPIDVVVGGLPSGVTLANKAGDEPDGRPYASPMAAGSVLQPGSTLTLVLKFANPARVTFSSTLQILHTVEVAPSAPSLLGVVATGQTSAYLVGRVEGAADQDITLQASSSRTCVLGTLVGGATAGDPVAARTDRDGYFGVAVSGVSPGDFVTVRLTSPAPTAASTCLIASRDNDSWPKAFLLDGATSTVSDFIDAPGKARWYKFAVTPGQRIDIKLTGLPADYDLAAFKDIGQAFASQFNPATAGASDLLKLTAEYAPSTFSPSTFSPSTFSPSTFSPDAYSPSTFSPSTFSSSVFSPSTFSPSTFSPSTFSPSTFSPSTFSPSTFSPSTFSPSTFSPSIYTLTEIQQAFSTAQTRSIVAISATAGLSDEATVVNTWNRTGFFYVRVTGRGGAFSTSSPFVVTVTKGITTCAGVTDTALTARPAVPASGLKTVLLADSSKTALDAALPGPAGGTLRSRLAAFAARAEIKGVVVDVAGDARVSALKQQAANNPACPFAKNLVAEEIKGIVDVYRANPLQYVVLVGNDDAIPFFRSPDQSAIGPESGYVPPVQSNSPSEASLRRDYVLSQDKYGSKTSIALPWNDFPVPGLAVGRLVETASEIAGLIDAYVAADAVVSPHTSLVTGYDFLEDAANAVKSELDAGTGSAGDALITPNGTSPQAPASWTADQLGAKLFGSRHDVIFLAGHFSANSALAADFATSVLTTDLLASTTDFTNSIVFSAGCHAGYNLVDGDAIPGVTLPLDWAQAFARKRATLVAGTGYQYGDTDFLEYSERLYNNFARQLRAGSAGTPIAVGEALVQAKLAYLAATPDIRGLHEKALLEATLFGLPMLAVNMPAGRGELPGTSGAIGPSPVATGPAASLGLRTFDLGVAPNLTPRTQILTNLSGGPSITANWLSGPDGVVVKPGEPALPLAVINVTPNDPQLVLRGIGYRGGTYVDSGPLFPFTGAATTESRGVHVPFLSPVFYPSTMWTPNYFGALAGNGGTQLLVSAAQYRAANIAQGTSTQRRHSGMNLRLFYSGNLSQAALSDAPSIVAVDAQVDATGGIAFSAQVVGDPAAAIYQVWVTYTGDGTNAWASLDLSQCVAPLPVACGASEDSRVWKGRLASPPANLKYFVQAANGVGLVSRSDNFGAYFGIASVLPTTTRLELLSPPSSAIVGDSPTVTARLTYAGGVALAGKMVSVGVGGASRFGLTGVDGTVAIRLPVAAEPGNYLITAAFASDEVYQASSASAPLTINRAAVTPTVLPPIGGAASAGINITGALGSTNAGLQGVPVTFTVNVAGSPTPITVYSITDYLGNAIFPPPSGLPPGNYTVTQASFGGNGTYAPTTITFPPGTQVSVPKLDQSINFPALADRAFGVPDFDPGAQASSLLPVSYGASGACTVAGSMVHLTGTGSCTITADQAGDATYNAAARVTRSFAIGAAAAAPTVLSLVRAVNSPTMADSVTYTLTFSEAVTGVTAGNVAVAATGIAAASVAGVVAVPPTPPAATWTVTVSTGRGTGTLHLDVVNGIGITNAAGTALAGTPFTGETYQIDKGGTVIGAGEGRPVAGFGSSGYALFGDVQEVTPPAVAVLVDGRILAAGGTQCIFTPVFGGCSLQLSRYSATGAPDPSFGTNGRVVTDVTNINFELSALIVNADETFFVNGSRNNGTAQVPFVAKFTSAGLPVSTFGTNGVASLNSLPLGFAIVGSAIDGSGRILIASTTPDVGPERSDIFVTRLTSAGAIDTTFGNGGVAQFAISTVDERDDRGTAVAVQPDGKIVVGGRTELTPGLGFDFLLLRLDANGVLDPSFNNGGIATTRFTGSTGDNLGRKLVLQPDGKIILVGGVAAGAVIAQCGIARFNANGTLDGTFGTGGQVLEPVTVGCFDVSQQADGKLVIAANDKIADVNYATFLRLLSTGAPDASFGTDGFVDISGFGTPTRVAFTSSGNLVTSLVIQDPADGVLKSYVVELSGASVANQPPVANAGLDQSVTAGATVQMTSAGSSDPEGGPLVYAWSFTSRPSGSAAAFNNSAFANPTFIADKKGTYVAQLIVTDAGTPPLSSAPDTVEITATNRVPAAAADSYSVAQGGTLVVNAATGVLANDTDADGDTLTAALVANVTHGSLTLNLDGGFTYTPTPGYSGPDSFTYRANDGTDDSNTVTVSITVTVVAVNHPPVANAGSNQNATAGQLVHLSGSCTDVDNDPTTPAWSFTVKPAGSNAALSPSTSILNPTFTPDLAGSYQLQLICNDTHVDGAPSSVTITATSATLTLALPSALVGVGGTLSGTITSSVPAPAGGVQVTLVSSNTAFATVTPPTVTIAAGATTGSFTVTGVAPGSSTITGSAAGYSSGSVDVQVTSSAIVVGTLALIPGQPGDFAVVLTTPAPAGGVTVSLTSSDVGVVTVPASVSIAAGATAPATDPIATGVAPGTATITATAPGYAPGIGSVTVEQPTLLTVTNTNDSGAGSLRATIAQANLAPDANVIVFAPGVIGTITLTTGQIRIEGPLAIVGPGAGNLTIDGNLNGRIFTIIENNAPACPALSGPGDFQVSIFGLTLRRGSRNVADSSGGAIQTAKSLLLEDVTIRDSQAKGGGALVFNAQYPGQALSVSSSQFIDNVAKPVVAGDTNSHNGGAILVHDYCPDTRIPAVVAIDTSAFSGNRVQPVALEGRGGAIAVYDNSTLIISDTRIVDNHVEPPVPPVAGFAYPGGGMQTTTTSVTIYRSEIAGNSADYGGGLSIAADIPGLQAPGSAFSFLLLDSTVSGNVANQSSGGINVHANVGATIANSTVSDNAAPATRTGGIGISNGPTNPPSATNAAPPTLSLVSSIVANSPSNTADIGGLPSAFIPSPFTVNATNSLVGLAPGPNFVVAGAGNRIGADPQLAALAFNGGPTRTHALLAGSPAIDTGSNPYVLTTDQRGDGFARVSGAAADIGAYEAVGTPVNHAPVASAGSDQNAATGQLVHLGGTCTDVDNDSTTPTWSFASRPAGSNAALSSTSILNPTFTPDIAGAYVLRLVCNDTHIDSAPSTVTITVVNSTITLTLTSPLVGVNGTIDGTITLSAAAPAGGVQVTLVSSNTAFATVAPSPVTIAAGATTGSFTVTGVAVGNATITGSASGYTNGSINLGVTTNVIAVGFVAMAPGQTQGFTVTLAQPAPAGGVTVTLTSGDTAIVLVPASVQIPAGAIVPAVNPIATGVAPGIATITGTAAGYVTGTAWASIAAPVQWTVANGGNDRWYQFIYSPAGFTWQQAWAAASGNTFLGMPGYLATATSQAENDFLYALAKYPAGATGALFDPANPTVTLGSMSIAGADASTWLGGADAATEGTWRWVNGPETGNLFWTGDGNGSTPPGAFTWWDNPSTPGGASGNEPNASLAGEDFLQLRYSGGRWNDNSSSALVTLPGINPNGTRIRGPAAFLIEYSPATPPVTFTVTNNNDSGVGSLRDAIAQANLAPGPNTVAFAPGVTGTILLTSGQIAINGPLTIVGPGVNNLTIDANASSRIFSIFATDPACPALDGPDYLVSISGLRLTNARRITSNAGGAIFSEHSLALDSVIVDNSTAGTGGGAYVSIQYPGQSLTIGNTQFVNNIAQPLTATPGNSNGGALAVVERCAGTLTTPVSVSIANSVFSGNRSQPAGVEGHGGAILMSGYADVTITDTRIVDNHVVLPAQPVGNNNGGGLWSRMKSLRIERSEISENSADFGGGLRFNNDVPGLQTPALATPVKIVNSTISGNVAGGGAIQSAGAIHVFGNVALELDNSTVSNNSAVTFTGGIVLSTGATDPVSASNATAPTLTLVSSIVANSAGPGGDVGTATSVIPAFTIAASNSLVESVCAGCNISLSGTGNLVSVDPMLGPLAFNGGPTRTHALLAGSPAINTGSNPLGLTTDQRGIGNARVVGAAADMGAYEAVFGPAITLSLTSPLVGVTRTINGTVTLSQPAPAGGLEVSLASGNTSLVTVAPSSVTIAAGGTTASFTVTGVALGGPVTLTGSGAGFANGTTSVTVTNALVSLGALPTIGLGQSVSLPVSLTAPAPAGGLTVSFVSSDPTVATVAASVFIAAGQTIPAANPQVVGVNIGSAQISASAAGFAPDARMANVQVSVTFTPTTLSVPQSTSQDITVNISAPAPAGGLTVALATANSAIATVASPITILQGQLSATAAVTGVAVGTTTLQATGSGVTSGTATINVTTPPAVNLNIGNQTIGKDLQVQPSVSLSVAAPAGGLVVTLTSSDASKVLLSTSATAAGSASVTVTIPAGNSSSSAFFIQGLSDTGTAIVTASATGYAPDTATITLSPSGFYNSSPGSSTFTTTTFSANTLFRVQAARLTAAGVFQAGQDVRGGITVNVPVTVTDVTGTNVGSITVSPVVFSGGDGFKDTAFDPISAGTAQITIGVPAGFIAPSNVPQTVTATVTAPAITINSQTIGKDLQVQPSLFLGAPAPAGGLVVTLTSSDASKVLLSTSATAAGSASITVTIPAGNSSSSAFFIQGLSDTGTATVTGSAPGFATTVNNITLSPSGFYNSSPGSSTFTTTTFSANTLFRVQAARLTAAGVFQAGQDVRGGITVNVPVTVTDVTGTNVGSITVSPVVFSGGDGFKDTAFDPISAGTAQITIGVPAGFIAPSNVPQTVTATVTAPAITINSQTIGKDLQVQPSLFLGAPAPAGGLVVTLTSSDASKVLLSTSATAAGSASITVTIPAGNSSSSAFFIQGLSDTGTATVTGSAPGFATTVNNITLSPSGFYNSSPGSSTFTTTTFSANTLFRVQAARLTAAGVFQAGQDVRGGITVNVPVTVTDVTGTNVGSITVSPVVFSGGDGFKDTAFHPISAGTAQITIGVPAGFIAPSNVPQTVTATVTAPPISMGNVTVGRDLQTSVSISLGATPPSPVTVTLTVASSAIALISNSATAVGGTTVTFSNVTTTSVGTIFVQGVALGGTQITVQAPGYSDDTSTVTVSPSGFYNSSPGSSTFTTTTFSANTLFRVQAARLTAAGVFQAGQDVRGGITVNVPVTVTDVTGTNVGSITVSPVVFSGGDGFKDTAFDPISAGTAQITIGVPAGFIAPSNVPQTVTATVTAPAITINSQTIGKDLQVQPSLFLGAPAPAGGLVVTLTSSDASKVLLSTSATAAGSASITVTIPAGNSSSSAFFIQGLSDTGTATVTGSAPGFATTVNNITLSPSGFYNSSPGSSTFTTTTFSANTLFRVQAARLTAAGVFQAGQDVRGGITVNVPVTVTDVTGTNVGSITVSPVVFSGGDGFKDTAFDPISAGTAQITIGVPAGFIAPSNVPQTVTATVTAPAINLANQTIGRDLQVQPLVSLGVVAPAGGLVVTLTSSDASKVLLSTSATAAGSASITVTVPAGNSSVGGFAIQALSDTGSATITATATAFASDTATITLTPSGFVNSSPGGNFTVAAGSANRLFRVQPARLDATFLNFAAVQELRGGIGPVIVPVTSGTPSVGTITASPLSFSGGDSLKDTAFDPLAVGTTVLTVGVPAGFATPSNLRLITATVN